MAKEEEFKEVGYIEALYKPKPEERLYILLYEGKGEQYSGFGPIPDELQEAFNKHWKVEIKYTRKQGKDRMFRNIIKGKYTVFAEAEAEKEEKKVPAPKEEKKESNFKTADRVNEVQTLLDINAGIMSKCHEAVGKILNRDPTTDGEIAMVNSMFIQMNRDIPAAARMKVIQKKVEEMKNNAHRVPPAEE